MHITMAIIIGQYAGSRRCPRQGCSSNAFSDTDLEGVAGTIWYGIIVALSSISILS